MDARQTVRNSTHSQSYTSHFVVPCDSPQASARVAALSLLHLDNEGVRMARTLSLSTRFFISHCKNAPQNIWTRQSLYAFDSERMALEPFRGIDAGKCFGRLVLLQPRGWRRRTTVKLKTPRDSNDSHRD